MKKEPIGVKGPMKKSEVYSSGSNLFAHKPVLTRKDSRPIKGGGEMDSPEGATIILIIILVDSYLWSDVRWHPRLVGARRFMCERAEGASRLPQCRRVGRGDVGVVESHEKFHVANQGL